MDIEGAMGSSGGVMVGDSRTVSGAAMWPLACDGLLFESMGSFSACCVGTVLGRKSWSAYRVTKV